MIGFETEMLPPFGAEIKMDVSLPRSAEQDEEILALYLEHGLLVFRNQTLSTDDQNALAALIGPVLDRDASGEGYVSRDASRGLFASGGLAYHSDMSFGPSPYLAISLYGEEVDNDRSSTLFASGYRAVDLLSNGLRSRLMGKNAVHAYHPADQSRRLPVGEVPPEFPRASHPIFWEHPISGRPFVYVGELDTELIEGLPEPESEALLQEVFAVVYSSENVHQHSWRQGDLVLWDNRAIQHARPNLEQAGRRTLRRTVNAQAGFAELYPTVLEQRDHYLASRSWPDGVK